MTARKGLACEFCRVNAACMTARLAGESRTEFREVRITNTYRKRQVIFYEGHEPHGVFVVCSGRIKVFKSDGKGHQLTVRIVGQGEILGHAAVLAAAPYAETAEALEETTLAYLDAARFTRFLATEPALVAAMLADL